MTGCFEETNTEMHACTVEMTQEAKKYAQEALAEASWALAGLSVFLFMQGAFYLLFWLVSL